MNTIERALVGLAGLALGLIGAYFLGYSHGKTTQDRHYQPILAALEGERRLAEGRLQALKTASAALSVDQESARAQRETDLETRADTAEHAYAASLRALAARHGCAESAVVSAPAEPSGPAGIAQCTGELAASFRTLAERAVRDAERLGELQRFYDAQRALLALH